jgi:hypothetical protein
VSRFSEDLFDQKKKKDVILSPRGVRSILVLYLLADTVIRVVWVLLLLFYFMRTRKKKENPTTKSLFQFVQEDGSKQKIGCFRAGNRQML